MPRTYHFDRPIIAALGLVAITVIGFAPRHSLHPGLVWNASASAPLGLYWVVSTSTYRRGDLVLATPPDRVRDLAARRGYLPLGVPLIKRIAALYGDRICSDDGNVRVNGELLAQRLPFDARNRVLRGWNGCIRLDSSHELLLMRGVRDSFDGRYFGATPIADNLGKLRPLWTW